MEAVRVYPIDCPARARTSLISLLTGEHKEKCTAQMLTKIQVWGKIELLFGGQLGIV